MTNKSSTTSEHLTQRFNRFIGTSRAFMIGLAICVMWGISFLLESSWHATIVECVAMVSFLNIFMIQRAQNKDLKAIHLKLDELLASSNRASNSLIKAEEAPEYVLDQVHDIYKDLARHASEEKPRTSLTSELVEQVMETVHTEQNTQIVAIDYP